MVGARPQFVKLAPIDHELRSRGIEHVIVHTGQHYDPMLSEVFFSDLDISAPDEHLGVGSASHGKQTGAILAAMDDILLEYKPDWVLVYGDTNSTLAAALSAVKLQFPLAHLEAGLRSFNRSMPEEHNRVLTDHASDLLLAPTQQAANHLQREGIEEGVVVTGDVMTDVLYNTAQQLEGHSPTIQKSLDLQPGEYSVATIHRAENTDTPERLEQILDSLGDVDHPVVLLAHPRLLAKAAQHGIANVERGNLRVHPPLPYPELVSATRDARGVITDSGGLQKEAFLLRTPCTTVRSETEWTETVELGWNVLVEPGDALTAAASRPRPQDTAQAPYGDGKAAATVVQALESASAES